MGGMGENPRALAWRRVQPNIVGIGAVLIALVVSVSIAGSSTAAPETSAGAAPTAEASAQDVAEAWPTADDGAVPAATPTGAPADVVEDAVAAATGSAPGAGGEGSAAAAPRADGTPATRSGGSASGGTDPAPRSGGATAAPGPAPAPSTAPAPAPSPSTPPAPVAAPAPVVAPAPPPAPTPVGSESGDVLSLTNAQRSSAGLPALARNGALVSAACSWAVRMASTGSFAHSSGTAGFGAWGENIAAGYGSASSAMSGWMGSTGHRNNILHPGFTMMGACVATAADGTKYWVQQFGA